MKGAPIAYVAKQMGHSSPAVTLQYYARWIPDEDNERYVDRLDERERGENGTKMEPDPVSGEPRRNRTVNLRIKSPLLCQLS